MTIADSEALRARRARRHRAGDHSLCKRCAAVKSPAEPPGELGEPTSELRDLAARLAAAHRAEPGNALLARELRLTLQSLMSGGGSVDGELATLFAEFGAA